MLSIYQVGAIVMMISWRRERVWMSGVPPAKGIKLRDEQGAGAPVTHRETGWSRRCHVHHLRWDWLLTQKVGFMDLLGDSFSERCTG